MQSITEAGEKTLKERYRLEWQKAINGWPPKIPKRPNFRFSPDKWVYPFRMKWVAEKKIERGGGPPLSIFFWKTYSKTYLIIVDFDRCRTIRCMVNIVYEVNILALHNYI
jgi:hypothetical protein